LSKEEPVIFVRIRKPKRIVELEQLINSGQASEGEKKELDLRQRYAEMFSQFKERKVLFHPDVIAPLLAKDIDELTKKNKAARRRLNKTH